MQWNGSRRYGQLLLNQLAYEHENINSVVKEWLWLDSSGH